MASKKHLKMAKRAVAQSKAAFGRMDKGAIRSFKRLQFAIKGMEKGASDTEAARRVLADIWNLHLGLKRSSEARIAQSVRDLFRDEENLEEIMAHARAQEQADKDDIAKEEAQDDLSRRREAKKREAQEAARRAAEAKKAP